MSKRGAWGCTACDYSFSSITDFDMHRGGVFATSPGPANSRHCLTADEMRAKRMSLTQRGWTTG